MLRIIIIFITLLIAETCNAQTELNYQSADSITYAQFISKDYNALHQTAKKAFKEKIDFYFLRLRMGISYYEKRNYETALLHFKKAHKMNPADTLIQEYLYYSLQFTNRTEDAYDLANSFTETMQQKVHFKPFVAKDIASTMQSFSITGGVGYNTNIQDNKSNEYDDSLYVENTLQGETYLSNISFQNKITNRLKVYNNFSYFNVKSKGIIHSILNDTSKDYSNTSYQYNLGLSYRLKNQLMLGATFGYFKEKSNSFSASFDSINRNSVYSHNQFNHNAYSFTLYSFYRFRKFDFGLSASIANLSDSTQYQCEGTIAYYPFGNQNYYSISSCAFLQNGNEQNIILNQRFGLRVNKRIWTEVYVSCGNHQNYLPANGFIAYNTVEPIKYTLGISTGFQFGKLSIIPAYSLQQRESTFMQLNTKQETTNINNQYFNHLITTTLKWNF